MESVATDLYLDLIKRCLLNSIYEDESHHILPPTTLIQKIANKLSGGDRFWIKKQSYDTATRDEGLAWPTKAHSMIGVHRMNNLRKCVESVIQEKIPGDLLEAGVWRGGASIFMRAILKAYGITDRVVWLADSFKGLPAPDVKKYPADKTSRLHEFPQLAVSLEEVQRNFQKYDLLDSQVRFLRGFFSETLPNAPIEQLAVLRLDGDMYESTMDTLVNLYPKVSDGGYVIVDDYWLIPACQQAVNDFRVSNGISDEVITIDASGVYWRRFKSRDRK